MAENVMLNFAWCNNSFDFCFTQYAVCTNKGLSINKKMKIKEADGIVNGVRS